MQNTFLRACRKILRILFMKRNYHDIHGALFMAFLHGLMNFMELYKLLLLPILIKKVCKIFL